VTCIRRENEKSVPIIVCHYHICTVLHFPVSLEAELVLFQAGE